MKYRYDQHTIKHVLKTQRRLPYEHLPKGIIHFDCFRDNTLYLNDTLNGIIDFYYACSDTFITDISIAINDWCTDWQKDNGDINQDNYDAFLQGYETNRVLTPTEISCLPQMLQIYALHFWLTRTETKMLNKSGSQVLTKDPNEYRTLLYNRLDHFVV